MAKLLHVLLLSVCVTALIHGRSALAEELEPIGVLPKLDADWVINLDDQQSEIDPTSPFRWVVFRNK